MRPGEDRIRRAVLETVALGIVFAAVLFGSAGSLAWPVAWAVLAFYVAFSIAGFVVLPPELIAERAAVPAGTSHTDRIIAGSATLFLLPFSMIVCGLDSRFQWSPMIPMWIRVFCLSGFALGYSLSLWAAATNPFFSAFVRVQRERGHRVVAEGPYATVRHPGYAGPIAGHFLLPIALGSLWGLVPAVIGSFLLSLRIPYEERVLLEELPGYRAYTEQVRWRLIPGLW